MRSGAYLGLAPADREAYRRLRARLGRLRGSSYDVSGTCNLSCEGCLYFAMPAGQAPARSGTDADWAELFRREGERGVNFAYLAGAEPSLVPARLRAARDHIPRGVVFTNGTRRIPDDIDYRVHVSLWGLDDTAGLLRGADVNAKALRNYAGDPRAVFAFTVNARNIHEIEPAARLCASWGVVLTYSFYSPTEAYNGLIERQENGNTAYTRLGSAGVDLRLDGASLARARGRIMEALAAHPRTVRYSMHFNDWISRPTAELWSLDSRGVAIDCGNRLAGWHRHHGADARPSAGKCCSPNLDCRECRAYAMGFGSYMTRHDDFARDPAALQAWIEGATVWADLFLPSEASGPSPRATMPACKGDAVADEGPVLAEGQLLARRAPAPVGAEAGPADRQPWAT